METLTIDKVARAAGVGVETVRFYERTGLLDPPPRTPAGYRTYPPDAVDRLSFIRHAQRLGFTLTEIGDLLALHKGVVPCTDVKARATTKVAAIEEKIAALLVVKTDLLSLMEQCDSVCTTTCVVLLSPCACGCNERTSS